MGRPTAVIERATELERSDWSAAIELLVSANRVARTDEVEIALATLRHRSSDRLTAQSRLAPQLTAGDCPRIGDSGLPETTPADLTAASLRAAILGHGSLLVRGAIDVGRARDLVASIDQSFHAHGAWSAQEDIESRADRDALIGESTNGTDSAWFSMLDLEPRAAAVLGRKWVRAGGGLLLCDAPRAMFEILDLYSQMGLGSIVTEYLGGRPMLSGNKGTLRRVPLDAVGGWHQDGAFLGSGIRAINLWLTLTPCGVDAPGLDLIPRRFDEIVETGTGGSYFDWAVGPEVIESVTEGVGVVRPPLEAGDMVIFDDLNLHRTAIEPEMTRERHAIELWCFAPGAYPADHVPLVW